MLLPSTEVVLDIETMGTAHDAVVVSVGMVRIVWDTTLSAWVVPDEGSSYSFYMVLNATTQLQAHRSVETGSMTWWKDRRSGISDVLQQSLLCMNNLHHQCVGIHRFVREIYNTRLWGNGPNFDNKILNHLLGSVDITEPCHFRNDRDIRTVRDILSPDDMEAIPVNPLPHHALYDARQEARLLIAANHKLVAAGIKPWITRPTQN